MSAVRCGSAGRAARDQGGRLALHDGPDGLGRKPHGKTLPAPGLHSSKSASNDRADRRRCVVGHFSTLSIVCNIDIAFSTGAFRRDHAPRLHDGDGRRAGGGSGVPREAAAGLDGQVAAVAEPVHDMLPACTPSLRSARPVCTRMKRQSALEMQARRGTIYSPCHVALGVRLVLR